MTCVAQDDKEVPKPDDGGAVEVVTLRRVRRLLANAFFSDGFRRFGLRFARDYLRIAWDAWRHWGDADSGVMALLGHRVAYPNHSAALFLVHEIFVNCIYAFQARTRQPHIIDCGANIGMSVAFFKTLYPDASVLAFEPNPGTFEQLARNLSLNEWRDVRLVNAAVADTEGTMTLYSDGPGNGSLVASLDSRRGGAVEHAVRAVRLSAFVGGPVDFLKLDVEGAELGVVRELVDSGAITHVSELVIEVHRSESEPDHCASIARTLEAAGVQVTLIANLADGAALLRARKAQSMTRRSGEDG